MTDLVLAWISVFGIWPLAHPRHDFTTAMGVLDLTLHVTACGLLWWKIALDRKRRRA